MKRQRQRQRQTTATESGWRKGRIQIRVHSSNTLHNFYCQVFFGVWALRPLEHKTKAAKKKKKTERGNREGAKWSAGGSQRDCNKASSSVLFCFVFIFFCFTKQHKFYNIEKKNQWEKTSVLKGLRGGSWERLRVLCQDRPLLMQSTGPLPGPSLPNFLSPILSLSFLSPLAQARN